MQVEVSRETRMEAVPKQQMAQRADVMSRTFQAAQTEQGNRRGMADMVNDADVGVGVEVEVDVDVDASQIRPETPRRTTHPVALATTKVTKENSNSNSNSNTNTNNTNTLHVPLRPRNPPLYTRSHLRSRSHASALAPPMTRAQSLPLAYTATYPFAPSPTSSPALRPMSPMNHLSPSPYSPRSPNLRPSSPFRPRTPLEDSLTPPCSYDGAIQSISEDAELHVSRPTYLDYTSHPAPPARSLSLRRQRPSSPLHSLAPNPTTSRVPSGSSSPSVPPARFSEAFPPLHHYSSTSSFSSISTTPSSARSRSPSISSLETIEDAPDLEWEAIQADRAAKLLAVAEADEEEEEEEQPRRRGSLDIPGHRSVGFGFGRRGGDANRKRWSICGGERTVDLDLETIWED